VVLQPERKNDVHGRTAQSGQTDDQSADTKVASQTGAGRHGCLSGELPGDENDRATIEVIARR